MYNTTLLLVIVWIKILLLSHYLLLTGIPSKFCSIVYHNRAIAPHRGFFKGLKYPIYKKYLSLLLDKKVMESDCNNGKCYKHYFLCRL